MKNDESVMDSSGGVFMRPEGPQGELLPASDREGAESGNALLSRRQILRFTGAAGLALPFAFHASTAAGASLPDPSSGKEGEAPFWTEAGVDVMSALFTRRSLREFTGEPMPEDVLMKILAAGMNAPSAHNTQPWRFVVMREKASLERIPQVLPLKGFAVKAGAAVLVCFEQIPKEPDELALLSVACCIQNMLLACSALGYGGVWLQVYPEKEPMQAWRELTKLPPNIIPVTLVTMGTPVFRLPPVSRMDPAKIHFEDWTAK